MSDKPQAAAEPEKPKSKKMLIIILAAVLVLVVVGGGAAFFLLKKKPADDEEHGDGKAKSAAVHKKVDPKAPPVYLPMDNMVVNLADAGGGRFAQVGITFKVDDQATSDAIKLYMPSIRNAILMQISQRTSDELLAVEGKEKLTRAIVRETSSQLGHEVEDEEDDAVKTSKKRGPAPPPSPVQAVLFSSFIVQ